MCSDCPRPSLQKTEKPWIFKSWPVVAADHTNQKFGLLAALLRARCWQPAQSLFTRLEALDIDPMLEPSVSDALAALLAAFVAPLYNREFPGRKSPKPEEADATADGGDAMDVDDSGKLERISPLGGMSEFGSRVWPILKKLGIYVGADSRLFTHLCRLIGKGLATEDLAPAEVRCRPARPSLPSPRVVPALHHS